MSNSQDKSLTPRNYFLTSFGFNKSFKNAKEYDSKGEYGVDASVGFIYRLKENIFLQNSLGFVSDKTIITTNSLGGLPSSGVFEFKETNDWIKYSCELSFVLFRTKQHMFFLQGGIEPRYLVGSKAKASVMFPTPNPSTSAGEFSLLSRRTRFNLLPVLGIGFQSSLSDLTMMRVSLLYKRTLLKMVHVTNDSIIISYQDPEYTLNTYSASVAFCFRTR